MKNLTEQSEVRGEFGIDPWSRLFKELVAEQDALTLHLIRTLRPDINIYVNKQTLEDMKDFGND